MNSSGNTLPCSSSRPLCVTSYQDPVSVSLTPPKKLSPPSKLILNPSSSGLWPRVPPTHLCTHVSPTRPCSMMDASIYSHCFSLLPHPAFLETRDCHCSSHDPATLRNPCLAEPMSCPSLHSSPGPGLAHLYCRPTQRVMPRMTISWWREKKSKPREGMDRGEGNAAPGRNREWQPDDEDTEKQIASRKCRLGGQGTPHRAVLHWRNGWQGGPSSAGLGICICISCSWSQQAEAFFFFFFCTLRKSRDQGVSKVPQVRKLRPASLTPLLASVAKEKGP